MSDYFERLEGHLLDAVDRIADQSAPQRTRRERPLRAVPRGVRVLSWLALSAGVAVSLAVIVIASSLHHAGTTRSVSTGGAGVPTIDQVVPRVPRAVSEVLAADGSVLGYIDSGATRTVLPQSAMPSLVRDATVAVGVRR
jgi:hypothetical protein